MGLRRKGRELALQLLFQLHFNQDDIPGSIDIFWENQPECLPEAREFARILVAGTLDNLSAIDALIEKYAENWEIGRMAIVDRNILRFAVFELRFKQDIPPKVTINEAIEIAKKYSTPDSSRFINGILDKIAKQS
ncbi:MAG: transcription antitermination factor NusB [Candidatus Schekmanbacteria bacterium]|nr:transcription antitermination factor NusB [Candidatus Schekmanbacteria bacterium]